VKHEPEQPQPVVIPEPTPEQLARRKATVERILAHRATLPPIAPLTTADLVHMSRDDNFWYPKEAATTDANTPPER
jgi:hypothetical protein